MNMPDFKVTTDTCVVNSEGASSFIPIYKKTRENEKWNKLNIQLFAEDPEQGSRTNH